MIFSVFLPTSFKFVFCVFAYRSPLSLTLFTLYSSVPVIMHLYQCFFLCLVFSAFGHCHSTSSPVCCLRHAGILRFPTSCQEFCHLSSYSPSYIIIACSRSSRSRNHFLLIFLLLSGDIELNPGPVNFTLCSFNIRSILHPLHSAALSNLIDLYHPDLF